MKTSETLAELPVSNPRFVGKAVRRVEDPLLVTGRAEFVDDVAVPGLLHCAILRSPYPHARIKRIDVSRAEKLPGVAAVLTGEDAQRWSQPGMTLPPGWGGYCLATDKVRFVGEDVAAVAATSRYLAEDALELIDVEYEPLPALLDPLEAMRPGSPAIFEEKGTNVIFQRHFTWGSVDECFREADRVFAESFRWHRVGGNSIETFGLIGQWDPVDESVTLRGALQQPSQVALGLALALGLPTHKVRAIAYVQGGGFGSKGGGGGMYSAVLLSRKAGGRPVKWIQDRMEYLQAGFGQNWDRRYGASLAVKRDGTVLGFRVKLLEDGGAGGFSPASIGTLKPLACFTGCYAIPAAEYDVTVVATNKLPAGSYRGMGPPPHYTVLEQMMDVAARGLGLDPAEIRRRNYIAPERFPYTIPSGNEYDSGNYEAALDKVLEMSGYQALREAQAKARSQGRYIGVGVVNTIEPGVFDWNLFGPVGLPSVGVPEGVTVSIDLMGKIVARVGWAGQGQGQYTLITQVLADYFAVELSDVSVVCLDTLSAPPHFGPGGSRLGIAITAALLGAAGRLKDKLALVAAKLLGAAPGDVELMDGKLHVRGVAGAELPLAQVVATMLHRSDLLPPGVDPSPEATFAWTAPGRPPADDQGRTKSYLTAANACHVVVVEVDPETGQVKFLRYCIADDCGTRLNPSNVEGMTDGGAAQGVGAALLEEYVYDDSGQPLTSTFMDYLLPTIHDVPALEKAALLTPSPFTPFGAKGVGEGAFHTTPAAVLCAINDALLPLGVRATELPASPQRLWRLIHEARRAQKPGADTPA